MYFPAGISAGFAESMAFLARNLGKAGADQDWPRRASWLSAIRKNRPPSMVTETSARVCVCQWLRPRELKMPSTDSELEKIPAVVSLCFFATSTIFFTPAARSWGVMAAVWAKCRDGSCVVSELSVALASASLESGMGKRSGSGCCTFARASEDATTRRKLSSSNLLVMARAVRPAKTVRTETTWFSSCNILMNRVVGETSEREVCAGEKNFDFVGGREFLDAVEDVGGLISELAFELVISVRLTLSFVVS